MEEKLELSNDEIMFCIVSKIHSFSRYNTNDCEGDRYYDIISNLYYTSSINTADIEFLEYYLNKNTYKKHFRYKSKLWYANRLLKKAKKELEEVKKLEG